MSAPRMLAVALAAVALGGAQPAFAKDACVLDSAGNFIKFTRLKVPRKPGAAAPVAGLLISDAGVPTAAITGSLVRLATGELAFGLVANGSGLLEGKSSTGSFIVDLSLAGSGWIDSDGDAQQTTPLDWEPIDCRDVPYP